jgi:hypothetical protein
MKGRYRIYREKWGSMSVQYIVESSRGDEGNRAFYTLLGAKIYLYMHIKRLEREYKYMMRKTKTISEYDDKGRKIT